MDRGRVPGQPFENFEKGRGLEAQRSAQNSDDTKGSDVQSIRNPETGRVTNNPQSIQDSDKRAGTDGGQPRKADAEKGTKTGGQSQSSLDRGRSESNPTLNTEKGTGHDSSRTLGTPRTTTR